jgi:hypothetical protein
MYRVPGEPCPHGFVVGTIAAARRSLAAWSSRNERSVCIFCGELVDLRRYARTPQS